MIHFLSGETKSVFTLNESHTITLDRLAKAESASVHTAPWLVPTWKRCTVLFFLHILNLYIYKTIKSENIYSQKPVVVDTVL